MLNKIKCYLFLTLFTGFAGTAAVAGQWSVKYSKAKVPFSAIARNLEYKGIAVQEKNYTIWGAAPVMDDEGKVHLFVARWPEKNVEPAWRKSSEIAHYVSDKPEGPFKFVSVVVRGSGVKGAWDCYSPSNPDIQRIDGKYVLTYIANSDYHQPPHPRNQQIGMMIADSPYGPWKKMGDNGLILDDSKDPSHFSHGMQVVNPTLARFRGKYFLYYKTAMRTKGRWRTVFAAAVADKLTGPYRHLDHPFSTGNVVIEDATAFVWKGKLCLLTTDNHGLVTGIRGGGALWVSDNGTSCNPAWTQVGYDQLWRYYPNYDARKVTKIYGRQVKIERPKILMIKGKPAYLYGASGCVMTGGPRTVSYVLKINLPDNASPVPWVVHTPQETPKAFQMTLKAPINRWDEAIPLGDGIIGGLLWGGGNEIRLSLDRGDLWDVRDYAAYANRDFNYQVVEKLAQAGKNQQLIRQYAKRTNYPTKLPGGRLVLTLPADQKVRSFRLDMKHATGSVQLGGDKIDCFVSVRKPVVLMKIPAEKVKLKLIANKAVKKLGYQPAQLGNTPDSAWFVQQAALGFQYVVYARMAHIPGGTLVAATITTNHQGRDPLKLAREITVQALQDGYDKMYIPHQQWWANFWGKSSVNIPDFKIQQQYNLVQYFYGAASRVDYPPIPLQGLWTADNGGLPPWHGDYHNDLNTQLTYWAYLTSGRFEQGLSFIDFLWKIKPVQEKWTRDFWGIHKGFVVPGVMALNGKAMGSWFQYTLSPTMGAWLAQAFYLHWRYTMDKGFLQGRAYPYCTGIANALVALMKPDKNGHLKLPLSSSPEIHNNSQQAWMMPNSNFDLGLIRWLLGANAKMARALGKPDEAAHWQFLLTKMDPLAVEGENGALRLSPNESLKHSHRHFSHLIAIYPLGILNIEGTARDRQIIDASLKQIDKLGTQAWCGYSFAWMACMRARAGQPRRALEYLTDYVNSFILRNGFHCNGEQTRKGLSGFHYRPFTLEGNFAASQAVHEMLLQSWGGRIRIFPAVVPEWKDVSFDRLRAEGGFIVSARRKDGKTQQITITATTSQYLRLKYPFGKYDYASNMPLVRINNDLCCSMKKGQKLELRMKNVH